MTSSIEYPPAYQTMLERDGHQNARAFAHMISEMFKGIDLRDKRVLEIGSGRGLLAIYVALRGASQVVSMEPEMVGATSGVVADQRSRIATLGLDNIEVVTADFNEWQGDARGFDVVVSRASLNHLYATDRNAEGDNVAFENYLEIARKIHGLLKPGGRFIATDACRYGFFSGLSDLGIRRPWRWKRSNVNWRHHQQPATWTKIFRRAGFNQVTVDYPVPYSLRSIGAIANTALANFFLKGSFILRADR